MPPKKKANDTEERPKTQTDIDAQSLKAEIIDSREKIIQYTERLEDNMKKTQEAKKLEEHMSPLEEIKRKGPIKLRRAVTGDSEDSQGCSKALRELHVEAAETIIRVLLEIIKSPKTKQESDLLEKGGFDDDSTDLQCPPGICSEMFSKAISIRHQRLVAEDQLDTFRSQLVPLKEHLEAEKSSGTCRSALKRMERTLEAKLEEQKEVQKKLQQEEDDWNRARQEQEWQNQVRAQTDGGKKK